MMKKLLTVILVLSCSLKAMDAPDVQVKVRNDSTETMYVKAYEYDPGYITSSYNDLSKVIPIKPGSTESISVEVQSAKQRYLYYHTEEEMIPSQLNTYRALPSTLDKEYGLALTTLRVTNTGDRPGYVKVYDYEYGTVKGTYQPQTDAKAIRPGETVEIVIPSKSSLPQRFLYYSENKLMIFPSSTLNEEIPAQLGPGGYDISIRILTPVGERAAAYIKQYNEKHPQGAELKWVRSGSPELIAQEQEFLRNRERVTNPAIHNILADQGYTRERYPDLDDWKMPRVAICTSGGGPRAMLASLGFTQASSETGVLDTVTYGAALSGSTWMWLKWLHDGATSDVLPQVEKEISEALNKGLLSPKILEKSIFEQLEILITHKLWEHKIPISYEFKGRFFAESRDSDPPIVSVYGMLLADALFANDPDRYTITLSSLADRALSGTMPLPLCTAISSKELGSFERESKHGHPTDYSWFEFSPFSVGILESTTWAGNGYIPTWALGRRYEKGLLRGVTSAKDKVWAFNSKVQEYLNKDAQYYGIEPALSQLVGAFGSAFTVDLNALKRMGTLPF